MSYPATVDEFIAMQPHYDRRRWWLKKGIRAIMNLICKFDIGGGENIPPNGGTIMMINHVSALDPALLTSVIPNRYAVTMAKVETLDGLVPRLSIYLWGNFVVKRGEVDRVALTTALELVKRGQMLIMAPEGTRNKEGLKEPKEGIAYIAQKTDCIILPTIVVGVENWRQNISAFKRSPTVVRFGKPFRFNTASGGHVNKETRGTMMREAMYQLALTIPEEHAQFRGDYRDVENATTQHLSFI